MWSGQQPSIWATKKSIPNSKVSIMVKEGFGGLLEADPSVEHVLEVKRHRGSFLHQAISQLSFLKDIREQHFDLVVDLRLGDRGAFMSFITGAPYRVTMHHPEGVPFWRKYFFTHGIVPGPNIHKRGATDQSLRILRMLGIDSDNIIPKLWVTDRVKRRIGEIMARKKVDKLTSWISINPFSRWSYKEWDMHKWIELINPDYAIGV